MIILGYSFHVAARVTGDPESLVIENGKPSAHTARKNSYDL